MIRLSARDLMRLPVETRRKMMAESALSLLQLAEHYTEDAEVKEWMAADMSGPRSKCCAAPVKVGGERSTHWYICEKCGKACDAK